MIAGSDANAEVRPSRGEHVRLRVAMMTRGRTMRGTCEVSVAKIQRRLGLR